MTVEQTPEQRAETLRRKVSDLEEKANKLTGEILFADELTAVSRRHGRLEELTGNLAKLRQREWVWGADLEETLAGLSGAGATCLSEARTETQAVADRLRRRIDETVRTARNLAGDANLLNDENRIDSLARQVEGLEEAVREARQRVEAITKGFTEPFDRLDRRLRTASKTLDRFDDRSFDLLPEESPRAAFEATWKECPDGDEKEGLLLLTDHRLRFEQREEVVTKRKLLIFAAEKELIKKCWIDEPVGHLEGSEDRTKGLVFKDQLVILTWSGKSRWSPKTTFELGEGKAAEVDELIEALLSGDVESDRLVEGDTPAAAAAPAALEWPEECDDCGARLEPPVKGQTRISCQYCGRTFQVREAEG